MNYFDLLDDDILLKIEYLKYEIEKLEIFVKDIDRYWYYETEYD